MSGSATPTTISNMALGHLGKKTIDSIDSSALEAKACKEFYDIALGVLLEDHKYGFAERRVALAVVAGVDPSTYTPYSIAYSYPGDCIIANRIYNASTDDPLSKIPFILGTNAAKDKTYILTSQEDAHLIYTARTESFTTMKSNTFQLALSFQLAALVGGKLNVDEAKIEKMYNRYFGYESKAKTKDSNEQHERIDYSDQYLDEMDIA